MLLSSLPHDIVYLILQHAAAQAESSASFISSVRLSRNLYEVYKTHQAVLLQTLLRNLLKENYDSAIKLALYEIGPDSDAPLRSSVFIHAFESHQLAILFARFVGTFNVLGTRIHQIAQGGAVLTTPRGGGFAQGGTGLTTPTNLFLSSFPSSATVYYRHNMPFTLSHMISEVYNFALIPINSQEEHELSPVEKLTTPATIAISWDSYAIRFFCSLAQIQEMELDDGRIVQLNTLIDTILETGAWRVMAEVFGVREYTAKLEEVAWKDGNKGCVRFMHEWGRWVRKDGMAKLMAWAGQTWMASEGIAGAGRS